VREQEALQQEVLLTLLGQLKHAGIELLHYIDLTLDER
jgi:hypothetical protein